MMEACPWRFQQANYERTLEAELAASANLIPVVVTISATTTRPRPSLFALYRAASMLVITSLTDKS